MLAPLPIDVPATSPWPNPVFPAGRTNLPEFPINDDECLQADCPLIDLVVVGSVVIRYMRHIGTWISFTLKELDTFVREHQINLPGYKRLTKAQKHKLLAGLVTTGMLDLGRPGRYRVRSLMKDRYIEAWS